MTRPPAYTVPIASILAMGDDVRIQNPRLQQTAGRLPRWFIRPYVDRLNPETGELESVQERIYIGPCAELTKKQAVVRKNEILATINRRQYVVQAQLRFSDLLDRYVKEHVNAPGILSASTAGKYTTHIRNHIRPAFGDLALAQVTTARIDEWLAAKARSAGVDAQGGARPGLSWATRQDLRNILCGIFAQAERWGLWRERNPAIAATVGRRRAVRERRKLTVEQTAVLLAALPADVALICKTALFCTLRISEVLGLRWAHVDWSRGSVRVVERYYRGDVDVVKSDRSNREVPLGHLADDLRRIYPGEGRIEEHVFSVETHYRSGRVRPRACRDDRDINQHFLRPTARRLGLYWVGFGFHAFRREAVTLLAAELGPHQAQRMAGHASADMTLHYTLADFEAQERAVKAFQERFMDPGGKATKQ